MSVDVAFRAEVLRVGKDEFPKFVAEHARRGWLVVRGHPFCVSELLAVAYNLQAIADVKIVVVVGTVRPTHVTLVQKTERLKELFKDMRPEEVNRLVLLDLDILPNGLCTVFAVGAKEDNAVNELAEGIEKMLEAELREEGGEEPPIAM